MWFVVAIVLITGLILWFVARSTESETEGAPVTNVSGEGLDLGDQLVPWASVYEVRVRTTRSRRATGFGFDVRTEDSGLVHVDGADGLGERFLGETHRLPGFDHDAARRALESGRSDVVCFSR